LFLACSIRSHATIRGRLCDLQTVPASLRYALGNRPRNSLGICTRKMIQKLPRTRDLTTAF
jgi:hypothetical protein